MSVKRLYTISAEPQDDPESSVRSSSNTSLLDNEHVPQPEERIITPVPPEAYLSEKNTDTSSPFSKLRVLIVDDSLMIRKVVQKTLASVGCECETASDGQAAIDKVLEKIQQGKNQFDLILMDNIMRPMDGIEATRLILKNGFTGLIFGATGNVMPDDVEKFHAVGAQEVLAKPLTLHDLEEALRKYLCKDTQISC
jgi:CheY-like chemotaxis protein